MAKTHTFKCDRTNNCGFVTHSLNAYLGHLCCRECSYIAVYESISRDSSWDLQRHYAEAHPESGRYTHWHVVYTINKLRNEGESDRAAKLMDFWGLSEKDLLKENLDDLNSLARDLLKAGKESEAGVVLAYVQKKAVELAAQ